MRLINLEEIREKNFQNKKIVDIPYPFLKWAGGKRQLISQITPYIPKNFNKYIEPFVGGGALFFYLLPKKAILIDKNAELINVYRVIKENVEELIANLKHHKNEKEYYYKIRDIDLKEEFKEWSDVQKASRTIYLNRCCYNGLYRVNSRGHFNVPFGRYKNPRFLDEKNLRAVHYTLQNAKILCASFEACLDYAEKGDFVYFDPPYFPISDTAYFTSYTKDNFTKEDQEKLFDVYRELDKRGCYCMLSNSYNEFILELYKDYKIIQVSAKRAINSVASKRGEITESLIINYHNQY
ncbi:MAG: DNA adenine methylase [Promethearchaeota archaeon]